MPSTPHPGRHELGQNFLTDSSIIRRVVTLTARHDGSLVEWGTGGGALTARLAELNRPLTGIEIDPARAAALDRRLGPHVSVTCGDILRHAPPRGAVVVSSVPFHITTKVLRHLLRSPGWHQAVLITQWEVARRRTGVGGATQLTAQWWPWYEFRLDRRIPAAAFTPRPSVDGGLFAVARRRRPLVPHEDRAAYQAWVAQVFGGRGRGLPEILRRTGVERSAAKRISAQAAGRRPPLPRDMSAEQWAAAWTSRR